MAPNNPLPIHGNEKTMNMNNLILTNIQSSPYFKVNLFELKTYHEVIDEIYYKVGHLEPWEKGSRKTAGQTGMCGGVRGVGAGGIVSSAFCLLYKLFTLKLTRKQVNGLLTHQDSGYIRALGFMYLRYTQPPADLWDWYEPYMEDEEEVDVKAGGGHTMAIGDMLKQWLTKLEWYSTLFPRIPVPVQKKNEEQLRAWEQAHNPEGLAQPQGPPPPPQTDEPLEGDVGPADYPEGGANPDAAFGEAERLTRLRGDSAQRSGSADKRKDRRPSPPFDIAKEIEKEKDRQRRPNRSRSRERTRRSRSPERRERKRSRSRERHGKRSRSKERKRSRSRDRHRHNRSRSRDRKRSRSRDRKRSRSLEKKRSRSRDRKHKHKHQSRTKEHSHTSNRGRETSFERDLRKEKDRIHRVKEKEKVKNGD